MSHTHSYERSLSKKVEGKDGKSGYNIGWNPKLELERDYPNFGYLLAFGRSGLNFIAREAFSLPPSFRGKKIFKMSKGEDLLKNQIKNDYKRIVFPILLIVIFSRKKHYIFLQKSPNFPLEIVKFSWKNRKVFLRIPPNFSEKLSTFHTKSVKIFQIFLKISLIFTQKL